MLLNVVDLSAQFLFRYLTILKITRKHGLLTLRMGETHVLGSLGIAFKKLLIGRDQH